MIICAEFPEEDDNRDKEIKEIYVMLGEMVDQVFDLREQRENLIKENELLRSKLKHYIEEYRVPQ